MRIRFWNSVITGAAALFLFNVAFCSSAFGQDDAFENFGSETRQGAGNIDVGDVGSATRQGADDNKLPSEQEPLIEREDLKPQQSIMVKENRAGWNQAGEGISRNRLSDELRSNWVMVDSNGLLRGTVIGFDNAPVPDATLYLVGNGKVVNSTSVNEQGQFSFNNVQQGTYGLVGMGETSFFAFGFNAIRNSNNPLARAPRSITVMAGPNETSINTDWVKHFGPDVTFRVYGRFESREGTDDPERLYGNEGISTHYPDSFPATTIQSHAVTALSDGRLVGRLHQIDSMTGRPVDVRNIRVMLLQNDDVYAATSADNFGVFDFTRIPPGFYTLVAAGDDGMAAIGLEVVANDPGVTFGNDSNEEGEDEENPDLAVVPIDLALVPSEGSGWLVAQATDFAYQRAIARSARINAERNRCNCPPVNPQEYERILEALRPSDRGQFWKKVNKYFDDLYNGENNSSRSQQQRPQQPQQFQQPQFQQPQFQQPQFQQPQFQQPQFQQPQFQAPQPLPLQFQQTPVPTPLQPVTAPGILLPVPETIPQNPPTL